MLYHDVCTIKVTEKIDKLDPGPARVAELGAVPCEVNPLDSTVGSETGPLRTRYVFLTNVDILTMVEQQAAAWKANPMPGTPSQGATLTLTYRGKTLALEAGIERHRVLGRFHHTEAIIKDYASLGA